MEFNPGDTHHILIGPGKPYKIHILSTVDDGMVVYKFYGIHVKKWHYDIKSKETLEVEINYLKIKEGS